MNARSIVLLIATLPAFLAPAGAGQDADVGARAVAALEARCASCHTPESDNKKARNALDAIRDVPRLVDEWVMAGDLDGSDLWYTIAEGDMPPEDAETGPLSDEEREAVRAWILAGAPLPEAREDPQGTGTEENTGTGLAETEEHAGHEHGDAGEFEVARLHILLVHFPVALLFAAALAELLVLFGRTSLRGTVVFCLVLACLGGVASSITGWWLAEGRKATELLGWHRWAGVLTAGLSVLALFVRGFGDGKRLLAYRLLLVAAVGLAVLAGHYGGSLVHGEGWLPFPEVLMPHED